MKYVDIYNVSRYLNEIEHDNTELRELNHKITGLSWKIQRDLSELKSILMRLTNEQKDQAEPDHKEVSELRI